MEYLQPVHDCLVNHPLSLTSRTVLSVYDTAESTKEVYVMQFQDLTTFSVRQGTALVNAMR